MPAHLIPGVQVYFIDGWRNSEATLRAFKARGLQVVCYFRWVDLYSALSHLRVLRFASQEH
jgi:hypothetical protein